jgi:two-component system nitrate/nitrite response regulator NarL
VARLSARELEILRCIERGDSNKAIARQLNVELQTVKNHVTHVLHKLGVRSRYDAARFAAQHLLGRNNRETGERRGAGIVEDERTES